MLNRVDRRSQLKCLETCIEMLLYPCTAVLHAVLLSTGHIMLNRVDRRSQLKCLQTCIEMLSKGASCLFFPEGTRSKDKVMGGFKKGAFSVAVKAGVPVVPITLIGTGRRVACMTLG
jgi:1-acyl-sn-glycerol-3-phosphate acyltransferase